MRKITAEEDSAIRGSVYGITVAFEDDDGNSAAPTTMLWTLTDLEGNVINSLEDEVVSSPTSSEVLVLEGDDLEFQTGESHKVWRHLTVKGVYNSTTLGNGVAYLDVLTFPVIDPNAIVTPPAP